MAFEEYLSNGVHIGMKQQAKDMMRFIYKVRPDGLAVMDVQLIDEKISIAAKFLSKFKKIIAVSRKPIAHKAVVKFAEAIGGKAFYGRFLPGTITNPDFPGYYEPDVVIVTDPYADSQAITEAVKMRIPIIAFCDTFNVTSNIDFVIPCNNKGKRSIAFLYWMLAKKMLEGRGEEIKSEAKDFVYDVKIKRAPARREGSGGRFGRRQMRR